MPFQEALMEVVEDSGFECKLLSTTPLAAQAAAMHDVRIAQLKVRAVAGSCRRLRRKRLETGWFGAIRESCRRFG